MLLLVMISAATAARADTLDWGTQPATNLLTTTRTVTINGVTLNISGAASGSNATQSLTIAPTSSSNGNTGYVWYQLDANSDDGTSFITTTINFSQPVYDLSFKVFDVDGRVTFFDGTSRFNDYVYLNSSAGLPTTVTTGTSSQYDAATGLASGNIDANITNTTGDVNVTFAGPVTWVTIRYAAGPVNNSTNPTIQYTYIDNLTWKKGPTLKLQKTSVAGTGTFSFGSPVNLASTPASITTTTAGTATPATPTAINITSINTATSLTETPAAGFALTGFSCTDANSAVTLNTGTFGTFSGNTVTIPAANVKPGADFTCNITNTKLPTLTLTKISSGGTGPFTFTGTNGWTSQTITTSTSGTGVAGATQTLAAASTATTITETIPTGYAVTAISCTGLGTGTATTNLAAGSVTLNAAATAPGNAVACTFTNTRRPTLTLTKISNGGTGPFTFTGTNGWTSQTITPTTSGTGVAGATQTLTAASTATTITEAAVAGYIVTAINCTGLGAGGTATVNLTARSVTLDAAATASTANIACTFTNTKLPTLTLTKISNGGTGSFTFTGNNGWTSQTITTTVSGTGVSGAAQTLTAASTATSITEAIPAGYVITSVTCTGLGSGTATPNLAAGTVTLDSAATAPGNTIACTFTNAKLPTLTLTKISNGGIGSFTFTGNNGWTSQTITTTVSGTGVTGAVQTLAAPSIATTISEALPTGYAATAITCTGLGSGTATPNLAAGSVTLDAAATAPGNVIACTITNAKLPTLTLTKISTGGTGSFTFTGNNGWASQTITTLTAGVGVSGATQTLSAASTATSITEAIPSDYFLTAVTCSGLGAGGTYTPTLSTGLVAFDAAATAPGANITCTFSNLRAAPAMSLVKTGTLVKAPGNLLASVAQAGDTINYTYVVTNTGNTTFSNVEIADVHGGTGSWSDPAHVSLTDNGTAGDSPDNNANATIWGTLAPGDTVSFAASYTVIQNDVDTLQ